MSEGELKKMAEAFRKSLGLEVIDILSCTDMALPAHCL